MTVEYITPDGEVIELGSKTPYQIACTNLVAFKLKTLETVAADPRLREASCTEAMIVYLSFLVVDKKTLKPKTVYASANKLMARGKMKSKNTAKKARQLLVKCGYLRKTGTTKDGCDRYAVLNPNIERVAMHVREAEEHLANLDADRKREERRKRKNGPDGVSTNDPPKKARGINECPDGVSTNDPNYHRGFHRGSCSEGREGLREEGTPPSNDNPYGSIDDDPTIPFEVPQSEAEANEILSHFGNVNPVVRSALRRMLMTGELTPAFIQANLGGFHA